MNLNENRIIFQTESKRKARKRSGEKPKSKYKEKRRIRNTERKIKEREKLI